MESTKYTSSFLDDVAHVYGAYKEEEFSSFLKDLCSETQSPIEQKFLLGFTLCLIANSLELDVGPLDPEKSLELRLAIQYPVEKYRADFAIQHGNTVVIVELDGHQWHERTAQERRYEKARDRRFTALGYKVLHFTGSEVNADPYSAGAEALEAAIGGKVIRFERSA